MKLHPKAHTQTDLEFRFMATTHADLVCYNLRGITINVIKEPQTFFTPTSGEEMAAF